MKVADDSFAKFPHCKFSVEQKFYSISDIENGTYSSNNPQLDFVDDPGIDEDDFDELCRHTFEADSEFEQAIIDDKNNDLKD